MKSLRTATVIQSVFRTDIPTELRGNLLAVHIFRYIGRFHKLPPLSFLKNLNWDMTPVIKSSDNEEDLTYRDYRFHAFMLKGIRKYGHAPEFLFYGLNLATSGIPHSLVLLGRNGSGKSTLYSAMEKIGKGQSNVALLRGYDHDRESIFLSHGNFPFSNSYIKLGIGSGQIIQGSVDILREPIIPEACFCSDFDVEQLEKTDNFSSFIQHQIGLSTLTALLSLIDDYRRSILEDLTNGSEPKESYDRKDESAGVFREFVESIITGVRNEIGPKIKEMVEYIVQDYFDEQEGEKFTVRYDENTWEISFDIDFKMPGTSEDENLTHIKMTPRQFLNTFRFKLFIFSLKLALGLCMKLFNKVDFPYIVDDMFDSSDFKNRLEIGNFFKKVIESHDRIILNEAKKMSS